MLLTLSNIESSHSLKRRPELNPAPPSNTLPFQAASEKQVRMRNKNPRANLTKQSYTRNILTPRKILQTAGSLLQHMIPGQGRSRFTSLQVYYERFHYEPTKERQKEGQACPARLFPTQ
jgi:hypothetical protein